MLVGYSRVPTDDQILSLQKDALLIYGGDEMYVILVYDIGQVDNNEGARVLRNVFKTCKKYLHHIQNSVFEGEISKAKLEKLKYELKEWIREERDSLIIFVENDNKWLKKEFLGLKEDKTSNMI